MRWRACSCSRRIFYCLMNPPITSTCKRKTYCSKRCRNLPGPWYSSRTTATSSTSSRRAFFRSRVAASTTIPAITKTFCGKRSAANPGSLFPAMNCNPDRWRKEQGSARSRKRQPKNSIPFSFARCGSAARSWRKKSRAAAISASQRAISQSHSPSQDAEAPRGVGGRNRALRSGNRRQRTGARKLQERPGIDPRGRADPRPPHAPERNDEGLGANRADPARAVAFGRIREFFRLTQDFAFESSLLRIRLCDLCALRVKAFDFSECSRVTAELQKKFAAAQRIRRQEFRM